MALPSELAMNIRIIKALGSIRPIGVCRHFAMGLVLRKMKRPNVITSEMFWRFLQTHFEVEKVESLTEACDFDLSEFGM
jgi:Chromatin modification-related protein EAF7